MIVYILFIVFLLLLEYSLSTMDVGYLRTNKEKRYLNIAAFILIVLTALRGSNVGTDTQNFLIMYIHHIPNYSFKEGYVGLEGSPVTFFLFKTFSILHFPPQILLGTISFIYISAIVRLINKFSTDKLYGFLCFFLIVGLYEFSVPALKQCIAMGCILHAFLYFYDRKYTQSVILVVLAYFSHKSSLVFLFGFILYFLREKKYYYYIVGSFVFICLLFSQQVLSSFLDLLNDDHYSGYMDESGRYSWVTFLFYLMINLSALVFYKSYSNNNKSESRIMYGFAFMALGLQALSSAVPSAFRLACYYLPFITVMLPCSFSMGGKRGGLYKFTVMIFLILFYFYVNRNGGNIVPYKFFWQEYDIPYIYFGG